MSRDEGARDVQETQAARERGEAVRSPGVRAVGLLSGGLDSALAIRVILDQGVDVLALNFTSPFCTCSPRGSTGCSMAAEVARTLGVEVRVLAKGLDFLRIVEHPRFGRGRAMNPCIDCRLYMLQRARAVMEAEGASFVFTGEVLGQRPMSQHRRALDLIERESGLAGKLLRPLSASFLEPTEPERAGLVDRAALLGIQGRSRKPQLALARERGVERFGCPAGGCLLTDRAVAGRIRDLFEHHPDYDLRDAKLATLGRHFRISPAVKVIVGRQEAENDQLARVGSHLPRAELKNRPGPLAVVRGAAGEVEKRITGQLLRRYAKGEPDGAEEVLWSDGGREEILLVSGTLSEETLDRTRI